MDETITPRVRLVFLCGAGSQECSRTWADFPLTRKRKTGRSISYRLVPARGKSLLLIIDGGRAGLELPVEVSSPIFLFLLFIVCYCLFLLFLFISL